MNWWKDIFYKKRRKIRKSQKTVKNHLQYCNWDIFFAYLFQVNIFVFSVSNSKKVIHNKWKKNINE